MNKLLICFFVLGAFIGCRNKKLDSTKAYFSVVDFLKAEVKKMDSLPLRFTKTATVDGSSATNEITREEFHKYAREFLDIPDIASPDNMDDYSEINDFDESLNNVLLMYISKKGTGSVKRETIMMEPDELGNTHVKTILIRTVDTEKEVTVTREMTWHIDKRLQIVTKNNEPNQPEKISTVAINWE